MFADMFACSLGIERKINNASLQTLKMVPIWLAPFGFNGPIFHRKKSTVGALKLFAICLPFDLKAHIEFPEKYLELRQYKNDSIQSKIIQTLKLPRFFPYCIGGEKRGNFKLGIIFV